MALYRDLARGGPLPPDDVAMLHLDKVLSHQGTMIWGAEVAGRIRAICTLHILPNITYGGRPYALIENVVSRAEMRRMSLGRAVMNAAIAAAWDARCYKIMLLTGSAEAQGFYQALGFDPDEKNAMILRR